MPCAPSTSDSNENAPPSARPRACVRAAAPRTTTARRGRATDAASSTPSARPLSSKRGSAGLAAGPTTPVFRPVKPVASATTLPAEPAELVVGQCGRRGTLRRRVLPSRGARGVRASTAVRCMHRKDDRRVDRAVEARRQRYEPRRVRRVSTTTGAPPSRGDGTTRRRAWSGGRGEGSSCDASMRRIVDSSSTPCTRSTTLSRRSSTTSTSMAPMKVRCPTLRVRVSMSGLYHAA